MGTDSNKSIFLSYASPDRDRIVPIYDSLCTKGFSPWMDVKNILPGQNWEFEVKKALDSALVIVIFVSENSVNRTGYVQKELRIALSKLQERPIHHIYVIPVILDRKAPIPPQLVDLQYIFADSADFLNLLLEALNYQLHQLGIVQNQRKQDSEVEWIFENYKESWKGLPGYEINISWPKYSSLKYPLINQSSDIIKGDIFSASAMWRLAKHEQMPDFFSFDQNEFIRTNSFHVKCKDPVIKGSILSQHISTHWYGAGAAHPNSNFRTWVFFLDPLVPISSLESCFSSSADALSHLQILVRQQLIRSLESNNSFADNDWIVQGTKGWGDFRIFTFEKNGIAISFDPYQVAPYASGPQFVLLPYKEVKSLLRTTVLEALLI